MRYTLCMGPLQAALLEEALAGDSVPRKVLDKCWGVSTLA